MPIVIRVEPVEYAHHNCISISFLELRRLLQELKARMLLKQVRKKWFPVLGNDCLRAVFGEQFKESTHVRLPMIVSIFPETDQLLLIDFGFSSELGQWPHFLLEPRKKHRREDFGYLE